MFLKESRKDGDLSDISLLVVLELNGGIFFADLISSGGTLKMGTNSLLLSKAVQLKDGMLSQVVILFHGKFLLRSLTCPLLTGEPIA